MANTGEPLLGLERNRPLHFAGRVRELRVLNDYLAYVRRTGDPTGGMILIDSVQGIGKTQLVAEFVRRAKEADADVHHLPLVTTDIPLDAKALFAALTRELRHPAARLAAASMGFPHHVHGYVAGALDALRAQGALEAEDALRQALAVGDANRTQFYESRLTAMAMPDAMHRLAAAMDEEQEERSLSRADATAVLKAHLPPEVDADEVLRSAIEKGVLTTAPDGYVSFGIPSFHDYMMEQHRRVLDREARRAQAHGQRADKQTGGG